MGHQRNKAQFILSGEDFKTALNPVKGPHGIGETGAIIAPLPILEELIYFFVEDFVVHVGNVEVI